MNIEESRQLDELKFEAIIRTIEQVLTDIGVSYPEEPTATDAIIFLASSAQKIGDFAVVIVNMMLHVNRPLFDAGVERVLQKLKETRE